MSCISVHETERAGLGEFDSIETWPNNCKYDLLISLQLNEFATSWIMSCAKYTPAHLRFLRIRIPTALFHPFDLLCVLCVLALLVFFQPTGVQSGLQTAIPIKCAIVHVSLFETLIHSCETCNNKVFDLFLSIDSEKEKRVQVYTVYIGIHTYLCRSMTNQPILFHAVSVYYTLPFKSIYIYLSLSFACATVFSICTWVCTCKMCNVH